jgi:hypothetical protein
MVTHGGDRPRARVLKAPARARTRPVLSVSSFASPAVRTEVIG